MITKATNEFPEIEWQMGRLSERIDHDAEYIATGESADGRKWGGTWYECDGQFVEILNIEEA